jgi:hypothetical protein
MAVDIYHADPVGKTKFVKKYKDLLQNFLKHIRVHGYPPSLSVRADIFIEEVRMDRNI